MIVKKFAISNVYIQKYLLHFYYVPGIIQGIRNKRMNKRHLPSSIPSFTGLEFRVILTLPHP